MKLTITFSAILSLCPFGDHVLFSCSTAMMLVFQASCSQISCDLFSSHRPTDPKPGNLFDAKRTKRGLPNPYGFFLGFLTTLLLRISVYLSFSLFCSLLSVKETETVQRPSIFPLEKTAMIYWPQGQWGGVRARYCAPVHLCAVKWSRNTKWKITVDRLFTSRHQASFKMGLIASPRSWS